MIRHLMTGLLLLASSPALAQVVEGSRGYQFPENNNALIAAQTRGGDPAEAGSVKIEFYAHMAFKITSPSGITVLLDPWRNDPSGAWGHWFPHEFPEVPVDLVISTHAHFDHDAVHRPHALMVLERPIGAFALGDVKITGLADKHQCHSEGDVKWDELAGELGASFCPPDNPLAFDNTLQLIETGGLRIVDWGDNRPVPSAALDRHLMNADVMILPIDDSQHILTYEDIEAIKARYRPKAIIPGHYLVKGAESVLSTLQSADAWVATQRDVRRPAEGELTISPTDLRDATDRTYYFGNGIKSK
ncbi:MBL fold metallo-hydrolase [Mesorhizobium sp. A556]